MLSTDIEKEIKCKKKAFLGFTIRQLLTVAVGGGLVIALVLMLGFETASIPIAIIGLLMFGLGWYEQDGMTAEQIVLRLVQRTFYKNMQRPYRTENRYVSLYDRAFLAEQKKGEKKNEKK